MKSRICSAIWSSFRVLLHRELQQGFSCVMQLSGAHDPGFDIC